MAKTTIATALLVALVISFCGCAENKFGAAVLHKEFHPLASGREVAEIWIEAPDETAVIKSDIAQDVVYLEHSSGKMALPERIPVTDLTANGVCEAGGFARVAVYHLVLDGTEVGYYKRRFARGDSTG